MRDGKRVIAVLVGSESDFAQMGSGLTMLNAATTNGEIEWGGVQVASIHWNTYEVLDYVRKLDKQG